MTQISSIREIQRWSMDFTKIAETLNLQFEETGIKPDFAINSKNLRDKFTSLLQWLSADDNNKTYEKLVELYMTTKNGQFIFNTAKSCVNMVYKLQMPDFNDEKRAAFVMYDILLKFEENKKNGILQEYDDLKAELMDLIPYSIPMIYEKGIGCEEIKLSALNGKDKEFFEKFENCNALEFVKIYICTERERKQHIVKDILESHCVNFFEKNVKKYFEKNVLPKVKYQGGRCSSELKKIMYENLDMKCSRYANMMNEFLRFRIAERHAFCIINEEALDGEFIKTGKIEEMDYQKFAETYSFEYLLKIFDSMDFEKRDRKLDGSYNIACLDLVLECVKHPLKDVSQKDYEKIIYRLLGELDEWGAYFQKKVNFILILENYQMLRKVEIEKSGSVDEVIKKLEKRLQNSNGKNVEIEKLLKIFEDSQ